MRIASLVAGTVVVLGMTALTGPSQAAPLSGAQSLPQLSIDTLSLKQDVQYRRWHRRGGYCGKWRHICADRWAWGSWRYRRCLRNHGC